MLKDGDRAPDPLEEALGLREAAREVFAERRARAAGLDGAECLRCPARELWSRIRHMDPGGLTTSDGVW